VGEIEMWWFVYDDVWFLLISGYKVCGIRDK
jgi:hypothetical protein